MGSCAVQPEVDVHDLHAAAAPTSRARAGQSACARRVSPAVGFGELVRRWSQPCQDDSGARDMHHRHAGAVSRLVRTRRPSRRHRRGMVVGSAARRRRLELRKHQERLDPRIVPHHDHGARSAPCLPAPPRRDRRRSRDERRSRLLLGAPALPIPPNWRHRGPCIPHASRSPRQWHFDIVRGLEHFIAAGAPCDDRLGDAIDEICRTRRSDGRWPTFARYPGREWFRMEARGPSRWSTLRAHRILRWWDGQPNEDTEPDITR